MDLPPVLSPLAQYVVTLFAALSAPIALYAAWLSVRMNRLTLREKERAEKKAREENSPIIRPTTEQVIAFGRPIEEITLRRVTPPGCFIVAPWILLGFVMGWALATIIFIISN